MMAIVRWEPFGGLLSIKSFMPDWQDLLPAVNLWPSMDVYSEGEDLLVKIEVPEVKPDEIDITLNDGYITVTGHHEHEVTENNKEYYRRERFAGEFAREIPLPRDINKEDVEANINDGVLEIRVKGFAKEVPVATRIPVSAGEHAAVSGEAAKLAAGHETAAENEGQSFETGPTATGKKSGRRTVKVGKPQGK